MFFFTSLIEIVYTVRNYTTMVDPGGEFMGFRSPLHPNKTVTRSFYYLWTQTFLEQQDCMQWLNIKSLIFTYLIIFLAAKQVLSFLNQSGDPSYQKFLASPLHNRTFFMYFWGNHNQRSHFSQCLLLGPNQFLL